MRAFFSLFFPFSFSSSVTCNFLFCAASSFLSSLFCLLR